MIRPARVTDASQAAPLLCAAWGHLTHALIGTRDHTEAKRIVADFFTQSANRLSYENALVTEWEGQVVGIALCYHGSQAPTLDIPLTEQLTARTGDPAAAVHVEAQPGEFYLDTLSVHPDYQRQGLGTELMQAFEGRATEQGCQTLGLLVETDNAPAQRLYAKLGYEPDGTRRLAGIPYDHWGKHR